MSGLKIEVITISQELLNGRIAHSNRAFICAHLYKIGYKVDRYTVLQANFLSIKRELERAYERSEVIIITGGLESTLGYVTRIAVTETFACNLVENALIVCDLQKRFGKKLGVLKEQALIPEKSQPLLNSIGTTPGFLFPINKKILVCLPGASEEMQHMFLEAFIPILQERYPSFHKYAVCLYGCLCKENQVNLMIRELKKQIPELEIGIYPFYSNITIALRSKNKLSLEYAESLIKTQFGSFFYLAPNGKIEEALHDWFIAKRKTLILAESCTGGTMASLLTAINGASKYFLGSFVTYSCELKQRILNVPKEILEKKGPVSSECVIAMLDGALEKSLADVGLAVSGIAGPTSDMSNQKIGTIWAAIQERGEPAYAFKLQITGDRQTIILKTVYSLFGILWRKLAKAIAPIN